MDRSPQTELNTCKCIVAIHLFICVQCNVLVIIWRAVSELISITLRNKIQQYIVRVQIKYAIIYVSFFRFVTAKNGKQNWSDTRTDKLRRDLLRFYDRHSRPVIGDNLTNVTVNTVIKYVNLVSDIISCGALLHPFTIRIIRTMIS